MRLQDAPLPPFIKDEEYSLICSVEPVILHSSDPIVTQRIEKYKKVINYPDIVQYFPFPFIFKLESRLFIAFEEWSPFFYEFIKYRVDSDPRFWRIVYYILLGLGLLLHFYVAFLFFKFYIFIKKETKTHYYTIKWSN